MQEKFLTRMGIILLTTCSINSFAATNETENVDLIVKKYVHAYEKHDLNTIALLYAPQAVAIGTGTDEVVHGRNKIISLFKRDFEQSKEATFTTKKIAIDVQNNAAFASYYMTAKVQLPGSTPFESEIRFTLGLLKENNQWQIVQSHCSAPLATQKAGESFPHA